MRVRAVAVAAAAVALGVLMPQASGDVDPTRAVPVPFDEVVACIEETPQAYAVPLGNGTPVIDVVIVLDGIDRDDAPALYESLPEPYAKVGLGMKIRYVEHEFADETPDNPDDGPGQGEYQRLIDEAKELFGGSRPLGSDVVLVATNKDLVDDTGDTSTAGFADCIGGVRYADKAFAVAEAYEGDETGTLRFASDGAAKVAAHEIGHLFGAHHHYANCGTTALSLADGRADICTLMFPTLDFPELEFSPTNGAIVRGHAEKWAKP